MATTTGGATHQGNSNAASCGGNSSVLRRPLGHLAPGAMPLRGADAVCGLREGGVASRAGGGGGLGSPVAISKSKKGEDAVQAPRPRPPPARVMSAAVMRGGQGLGLASRQKDGVFFRPMPKTRSGSWGGELDMCFVFVLCACFVWGGERGGVVSVSELLFVCFFGVWLLLYDSCVGPTPLGPAP